MALLDCF
jgi:hypothetical protein